MTSRYLLGLFLLSLAMSAVLCQTFQYSHGWTNGKRSGEPTLEEFIDTLSKSAAQTAAFNCQIQKLRLLLQGSADNVNRLLQVRCEPQTPPKRGYAENANTPGQLN